MADSPNARQQIVDKIKDASNILVTVSANPTVDDLSAALGLTVMLNKLKKHATAVVSGAMPPAITFLDPDKVFEGTADSLRDFIIALDKEKADHLRYKVEGDVVKIFITPYRTTVTEKDLEFSQGDYNVDLVMALGVMDEAHLDTALTAHGRILHDATVVTLSVGKEPSKLGNIDWRDESASSLCEMLVSLSEVLKGDKPLLDEQTSTALLTGIVAATDRFSNDQTSPKVMTMAAQLMAAGANQQLIASELEAQDLQANNPEPTPPTEEPKNSDGTTDLSEDTSAKLPEPAPAEPVLPTPTNVPQPDGTLTIAHELLGDVDEVAKQVSQDKNEQAREAAEQKLDELVKPAGGKSVPNLAKQLEAAEAVQTKASPEPVLPEPIIDGPSMGGTLNATTEQAAEDKAREESKDRNRTLLSHDGSSSKPMPTEEAAAPDTPLFNAASAPVDKSEPASIDPFAYIEEPVAPQKQEKPVEAEPAVEALPHEKIVEPLPEPGEQPAPAESAAPAPPPAPETNGVSETLAEIDAKVRVPEEDHHEAMAAVNAAFDAPGAPAPAATLPPLPDFSTLPPPPPPLPDLPASMGAPAGALSPEKLADIFSKEPAPSAQPAPGTEDPGQFKIPGQP